MPRRRRVLVTSDGTHHHGPWHHSDATLAEYRDEILSKVECPSVHLTRADGVLVVAPTTNSYVLIETKETS